MELRILEIMDHSISLKVETLQFNSCRVQTEESVICVELDLG